MYKVIISTLFNKGAVVNIFISSLSPTNKTQYRANLFRKIHFVGNVMMPALQQHKEMFILQSKC